MRTVERLSYFDLYVADYLLDTPELSLAEHGAYCTLMFRYYWQGSLKVGEIYRNCRSDADKALVDSIVARYFHIDGDRVLHNRIERELARLSNFIEHQSKAGKASAEARLAKKKARPKIAPANGATGFDEFIAAYPRKKEKARAEREWDKLRPDDELRAKIFAALTAQRASAEWKKEGGKFIPYPAKWIKERRWEDEIAPSQQGSFINDGTPGRPVM